MHKWIEKYKESNRKRLEKRIAKLKAEIKQYEADYNYSPRLYYKTAIERREQEIKELEALLYPKDLLRKIEDYKEDYGFQALGYESERNAGYHYHHGQQHYAQIECGEGLHHKKRYQIDQGADDLRPCVQPVYRGLSRIVLS